MTTIQTVMVIAVIALLLLVFIKLFKTPLKIVAKFFINMFLGFITLIIINFLGGFIGIGIGINWINAAIVGIFGVPGVALLLLLQWLMAL